MVKREDHAEVREVMIANLILIIEYLTDIKTFNYLHIRHVYTSTRKKLSFFVILGYSLHQILMQLEGSSFELFELL